MSKKSHGKCIFCGGGGLTKQHVWPDWLKNVLLRDSTEHMQFFTHYYPVAPNFMFIQPDIHFRQGHPGVRKIRNVCNKCNSGWMSKLEIEAKSILSSMILGERIILNTQAQVTISAWSVMISIIAEFTDQSTAAIPGLDRQKFFNTQLPPEGWKIWIGRYKGIQWKQRFRHHGMLVVPKTQIMTDKTACNTQFSTFVMGELLIHAISSALSEELNFADLDFTGKLNQMRCIWPLKQGNIEWPAFRNTK